MTCVVGLEKSGIVYMGCDGCSSSDTFQGISTQPKVFINKDLLIGFTTSWRMGQILRYVLVPPPLPPFYNKKDQFSADMQYLVVDLVDAIRKAFFDKGFMTKKDEVEEGGNFLIGFHGKLYEICDDFQVNSYNTGYAAVGCGASYAYGVLHDLCKYQRKLPPEVILRRALEAAAAHAGGVSPPFSFFRL